MSITRRRFLLSTAGSGLGFVIPSFYDKALAFWENHGEPLIQPTKGATEILYAWQEAELELNLGHPETEPSYEMTYRELIDNYFYGGLDTYLEELPYIDDDMKYDLDAYATPEEIVDAWIPVASPNVQAYHFIESLDLGPNLEGSDAVGGLHAGWGCPGNDYLGYLADDHVSLSLLQERLNQLKTGIRIEIV